MHNIQKQWVAVSTLLGVIGSVYRDLHNRRSNQRPQIAEAKRYNWVNSQCRMQMTPNQLVNIKKKHVHLFKKKWISLLYSPDIGLAVSVRQWPGRPGFNPRSSHTKDSKNGTWCLLA